MLTACPAYHRFDGTAGTSCNALHTMFRFHQRPSSSIPDDVYASSLFSLHRGYGLWFLEPHRTGEPQIGDVGYIRDGALIRLLNINTTKPEHKVTSWSTPFEVPDPLPAEWFEVDPRPESLAPGHYASHGVTRQQTRGSLDMCVLPPTLKVCRPDTL